MPALPPARGPITSRLLGALEEPPHTLDPAPFAVPGDALADEDLQLALYLLYELHYRGFDAVDDEWEWEPSLLALRRDLEGIFEGALLSRLGRPDAEGVTPQNVDVALRAIEEADDSPSLSRFIEREATAEQAREFVVHRSAYQLKEADPHSWALPRLTGTPKAAMVEIQSDEYGSGRAERIHSRLFAATMDELGLDPSYGAYVHRIPGVTLATVNLMSMLGLHRSHVGAIVGHLALFEMTSSVPNRRYGDGLRRLGFSARATDFFDEHVLADAVHESVAAVDLAGGLARQRPELTGQILWGARALTVVEGNWARHVLDAWQRGESSLLTEALAAA